MYIVLMNIHSKQAGITPSIYVYLAVTNLKFKRCSVSEDHDFNSEITAHTVGCIFLQIHFSATEYAKVYGFINML